MSAIHSISNSFIVKQENSPSISVALESLKLGLDEAAHVVLESLRPGLHEVDAVAAAVVGAAGVSAVVTGSDSVAVESSSTVGHGAGPLADDGPLVRARVDVCVVADVLAVLPRHHGDEIVGEARVLVVVDDDLLRVVVRGGEEAVVSVGGREAVVEHEGAGLGDHALVAVGVAVELARDIGVEGRVERFVQVFDRGDDIIIIRRGVLLLDRAQDGEGAGDGVALLPAGSGLLARVVEAVLRAGGSVQVDDDLDADLACPLDTLLEVLGCTLGIGRTGVVKGPVSYGDSDEVEAASLDLLEVRQLHPVVPVRLQNLIVCGLGSKRLCKSVLVDDSTRAVELLEDRWSYPRLQDEPAAEIDSSDFLRAPIESLSSLVEQLPGGVLAGMLSNGIVRMQLTEQPELRLPRKAR